MTALIIWASMGLSSSAIALEMPNVFGSDMVLQRDLPLRIWGKARPGDSVAVTFAQQTVKAIATSDGKWQVKLHAMPASTKPQTMMVAAAGKIIRFGNILVGDVWLCTGQSNMAYMRVELANNAKQEIASATDSQIRLCTVTEELAHQPQDDTKLKWQIGSPQTAAKFSAVGYFFGRELRAKLNVPIGLINSSKGGTRAEAWISMQAINSNPKLAYIHRAWKKNISYYPKRLERWEKNYKQAEIKSVQWIKDHPDQDPKEVHMHVQLPRKPQPPGNNRNAPAVLYNQMIHPLAPFGIKGVIWYQGESNTGRPNEYRDLLPAMINDWRTLWGQGDFPFGIVQLANFHAAENQPTDTGWAHLRDAQRYVSRTVPNTGLAVTIDIGDVNDVHPKNKQDVAKRLALWALHDVYGMTDLPYTAPIFDTSQILDSKFILTFKQVNGQLKTRDGKTPDSFIICGMDRKWVWAKAKRITNNQIEVWSDVISKPVAVRYAWADNPANPNLTDDSRLPASPFRTDDWAYHK